MKIFNFKKEKEPVRLAKKPEPKPLIEDIASIPIEFILITIIMISVFGLIIVFIGPCTDSGVWYNMPHI